MSRTDDSFLGAMTPEQMAGLLSLAQPGDGGTHSLPAVVSDPQRLGRLLAEVSPAGSCGADAFLHAVCAPDVTLEQLVELKRAAKRLLGGAATAEHRSALTLVYHATVAAAYGLHGARISSRPIEQRLGLYEDLAAALGHDPLGAVFRRAADRVAAEQEPAT